MKTYTVGDFKANFSEILKEVSNGAEFAVTFGKSKKVVAYIVPGRSKKGSGKRKLGVMKGKGEFIMKDDFKFNSVDEFLSL